MHVSLTMSSESQKQLFLITFTFSNSKTYCQPFISLICDGIWENLAYGGANSIFLDQLFPYIYIDIYFLNCAEGEKCVFCRCSYVTKCQGSGQSLLCLSLLKLFIPRPLAYYIVHVHALSNNKFNRVKRQHNLLSNPNRSCLTLGIWFTWFKVRVENKRKPGPTAKGITYMNITWIAKYGYTSRVQHELRPL